MCSIYWARNDRHKQKTLYCPNVNYIVHDGCCFVLVGYIAILMHIEGCFFLSAIGHNMPYPAESKDSEKKHSCCAPTVAKQAPCKMFGMYSAGIVFCLGFQFSSLQVGR